MVPSASTLRTTDVNGEHADTVAKAGDKPGTSKQTQAGALGVSKTVADAFPIHATDRETSSEAAIHRQPKQGTDIAVDANHTPKVSQSLIDSTTIYTTRVDTSKVDTSKTDTSKTDTSKVDTSKTDTSKTDTSKTDTSKTDTSKIDTSKIDTSKIDTSKVDPRSEAIPETATGESGKGSQLPGNGTSDHGSKHEGNTAIPSTGPGLESKGIQQAHSQSDFANVIGAQTSSAAIATVASSSTAALMDPAQSGDVASTHSSTRTAIDRSEQQAVEANPLTALQSPLQSARLIERVGQSELRVGFQAGELGSVDIRTSIVHNQVSAEISVERSELRNLLAIELPHLQEKLAAHQVTVTNIVLNNQSGGGSADSRQAYRQIAHTPQRSTSGPAESEAIPGAMSITESQIPSAQLDVHM
jgi:flagellar hook-length control protein FliK